MATAQRSYASQYTSSLLLWMIGKNIPLSELEKYRDQEGGSLGGDYKYVAGGKRDDNAINTIVNGLTQNVVVKQVAAEWNSFPPAIRMGITEACNGNRRSNNWYKGVLALDRLLGGKVLAKQTDGPTKRVLREDADGRLRSEQKSVSPAVAGAQRAQAEKVSLPPGYDSWTAAQKNGWRQQQRQLAKAAEQRPRW
jgi:hypothetical protein